MPSPQLPATSPRIPRSGFDRQPSNDAETKGQDFNLSGLTNTEGREQHDGQEGKAFSHDHGRSKEQSSTAQPDIEQHKILDDLMSLYRLTESSFLEARGEGVRSILRGISGNPDKSDDTQPSEARRNGMFENPQIMRRSSNAGTKLQEHQKALTEKLNEIDGWAEKHGGIEKAMDRDRREQLKFVKQVSASLAPSDGSL